ncbi:MAG TPA: ATP-binding protein [Chthoniobacterales bacterium]|nr:ATP-binding protein [Chthoniobacterales bacterium]
MSAESQNENESIAIEELPYSEGQYQLLFRCHPVPMWVYDLATLRFLTVNDAAIRHYGYSREEFLAMTIKDIRPAEDVPALLADVATNRSNPYVTSIWRHRKKDGTLIDVEVRSHEFQFGGRQAKLILANDITEQLRSEAQVCQLNEELEERVRERTAELRAANKELEAFSYSVSHDLRAPLRAIIGYSQLILEDYASRLDGEGKRLLGVVCSEAMRMGQLIDDLLAFSRLGRQPLAPTDIDMTALALSAFQTLLAGNPGETPQLRIKTLSPMRGDPVMLRQVFVNLLENAIKFTSKRKDAVIEVGGWATPDENVYYVKDNGVGFDEKYSDKLFGVFQRLHTDNEFSGTGVGLALVQRIVVRHGGKVWAESKPGEGATFYFAIPTRRNG